MKTWYNDLLFKENNNQIVKNGLEPLFMMFNSKEDFIKHFVENTIFFKPEHIEEQAEIFFNKRGDKNRLPVRYSAQCENYFYFKAENSRGYSVKKFKNKTEAKNFSDKNALYYKTEAGEEILVRIDKDGNYEVRNQIYNYTGIKVSQGAAISNYSNYTISHIWENSTTNPLYFTALWNIVLIPTYLAFILDKSDEHSELSKMMKNLMRGICKKLYNRPVTNNSYEPNDLIDKTLNNCKLTFI